MLGSVVQVHLSPPKYRYKFDLQRLKTRFMLRLKRVFSYLPYRSIPRSIPQYSARSIPACISSLSPGQGQTFRERDFFQGTFNDDAGLCSGLMNLAMQYFVF